MTAYGQETPKRVIRFYGNTTYALECIARKEIVFINTDELNDPFDPYLDLSECIGCSSDEFTEYAKTQGFKPKNPALAKVQWDNALNGLKEMAKKLRKAMFVFCTSKVDKENSPNANLYMWGHYAKGHRGVAIEFDTKLLEQATKDYSKRLGNFAFEGNIWERIDYPETLPKISAAQLFDGLYGESKDVIALVLDQIMRSKSPIWRKENEWRLMWHNDETKLATHKVSLLDNSITAVYLGCRLGKAKKEDFIFEIKHHFPNAQIFISKMKPGEWALDFELVSSEA